jgi:hypothetical protein
MVKEHHAKRNLRGLRARRERRRLLMLVSLRLIKQQKDGEKSPPRRGEQRKSGSATLFVKIPRLRDHEPARDRIELFVHLPALFALSLGWHHNVRYLQRWCLTRQCKHLVHSDPGSDRCITQPSFADRFLHSAGAQLGNVREDPDDTLFSCAYLRGFATFDGAYGFSSDVTPFANFV